MDNNPVTLTEHCRQLIRAAVSDKPWIVTTGVVVASLSIAKTLRELGATKVLAIGISRGTGSIYNTDPHITLLDMGITTAPDMMNAIRLEEETLGDLPDWVLEKVHLFDPTNERVSLANIYSGHESIAGRKAIGYRPESWQD